VRTVPPLPEMRLGSLPPKLAETRLLEVDTVRVALELPAGIPGLTLAPGFGLEIAVAEVRPAGRPEQRCWIMRRLVLKQSSPATITPPSALTARARPSEGLAEESLTWTVALQVPPLVRFARR
jgi:hypothetical protein